MGLPDRLHHVVNRGADGPAHPQGQLQAPREGRFWFALTGISNGLSALSLFAAVRNGPITLVAPLAAIYPLVTVALSAMMLKHVEITARIVAGTLLTVAGVALVLIA
ncbi:EamA family transporter [Bradyrhizobium sp. Pear77]|nr:EamA family transporter [Bradyrhizobium altum]